MTVVFWSSHAYGSRASGAAPPVEVQNLRVWSGSGYTRVVLDLDGAVEYREGRVHEPERLYVDLVGAFLSPTLGAREIAVGGGVVRVDAERNAVRLLLDVGEVARYDLFLLREPFRLVVDLLEIRGERGAAASPQVQDSPEPIGSPRGAPRQEPKAQPASEPLPEAKREGNSLTLSRQLGLAVRRVVLDAGHGGQDPGALSRTGLQEKDVVLDIARRVRAQLQNAGLEVLLTREDDRFIPLEERTAVANEWQADLLVSIHANASRAPRVRGVTSYYLHLADSTDAEELAAFENSTSGRGVGELGDVLRQILATAKTEESRELAHHIQEAVVKGILDRGAPRDLGVRTAPFLVLQGAQMPAVLEEVSFLSNEEEARLLGTELYRESLAEGIAFGIRSYAASFKIASSR